MRRSLFAFFLVVCSSASTFAAEPTDFSSQERLSQVLRTLILANLPDPLIQQNFNWGHQEMMPVGIKWETNGLLLKPEIMKKLHNEGDWRRIAVQAFNPEQNLLLTVKDLKVNGPDKLTFAIELEVPTRLKFEQQIWRKGTRLYSGETRARCKAILLLQCESTTRLDKTKGSLLPDLVFRLRIAEAKLNYYDLVVEHTLGIGGDAAKRLGEAVVETVKQWRPSLERNLLDKANAAIVKAGDTKEVRLGLSKLFDTKK